MKKITFVMAFIVMIIGIMCFTAGAAEYGNLEYRELDDGTLEIVGYIGENTKIEIPAVIDGKSVTSIGDEAFLSYLELEKITIPDSVTNIGYGAFEGCENLQSIIIPYGVTSIGEDTFLYCLDLEDIVIPDSVTSIGDGAFEDCIGLETITIPDSVTSIGNEAFMDCSWITSITISDSVTSIGYGAFSWCTELKTIEIPDGIKHIADATFEGCLKLKSVTIPKSVKSMGDNVFDSCESLTDVYYACDENQWKKITVNDADKEILSKAEFHFNYHEHTYSNKCDKTCDICEQEREASAHIYTNKCDTTCNECKAERSVKHSYKTIVSKAATLKKDGKTEKKCSICGKVKSTGTVYKIKSVKLSDTEFTYNKKKKTPFVVVKDSKGNTLKKDTDYTVKYPKKRTDIGKYIVTVTFKGKYSGTKKLTFEIIPAKVKLSKVTAGGKQFTASWKTVSGADGYIVEYSTSKKFTKKTTKTVKVKKGSSKKTTIKKLKKGSKYYVRVKAYTTVSKKTFYGAYSKSIKVTVK